MPHKQFGNYNIWYPRFFVDLAQLFHSLEIRLKLSLIIAFIVIVVVILFSMPVLIRQEQILSERVDETSRLIANKLMHDVRDIILFEIADVPSNRVDGSIEEQLGLLFRTEPEGLEFAFVLDKKGKLTVEPYDFAEKLSLDEEKQQRLLQLQEFRRGTNEKYIEYYYPVKVRKSSSTDITIGVVGLGFAKSTVQAPIDRTKGIIYSTGLAVIVISVMVIYFIASKMVNQLIELADAARQVGMGNLEVQVPTRGTDELGQLAREFNNMVRHLREKLQMQKFVSRLTVQMIQESEGNKPRLAQSERHDVTILFSDVRNFTTMAEKLEPEKIVQLINVYFQLQTELIEKYGGVVDKFMGDQIMAIFPTGNMLQNAVSAAVEIQRAMRKMNKERSRRGEVILEVGIGINHGPAVLGNMGSSHRMDYTVIGDVVNIASRLCSIARAGQIITAMGLVNNLNGKYATTRLQPIIVKGRSKHVEICEVDYDRNVIM
ncbi:MAG TPA: adenylate/guanylate cyclase domain-containing protein [Bacteroidetes bacterium]|nr:adenylate/guanylate cyclase domain-containing protein [Bacteroidota bacterium]